MNHKKIDRISISRTEGRNIEMLNLKFVFLNSIVKSSLKLEETKLQIVRT